MIEVKFYQDDEIPADKVKYVIMMTRYNNQWIVVRNKDRDTWELPAGRVELNEDLNSAAFRELYEETGTIACDLTPVSRYKVTDGDKETYGQLYFAEVDEMIELPEFEIEEIKFVDELPNKLTYPMIQPSLFAKVEEYLKNSIC